ncbi:MAG: HipA N-terminal domain-containing protein [Ignavibacteriaceae bacterium]|nr:HipA N-terminal domain-containing protein [Ignavibacteriaceae bacterium]
MKKAKVYNFGNYAGDLLEIEKGKKYKFVYDENYNGPAISLTMPISKKEYEYNNFPPFFEGLLPEGTQLDALVRQAKIDRNDFFSQLVLVGKDLVGSVSVSEE